MEFSFENNIPIYLQLLEYVKIYLISGVFKCGEKLPSVRDFATTFKVNPNTMQKALVELKSMNLIYYEYALSKNLSILGICAGMQLMALIDNEDCNSNEVLLRNEVDINHFQKEKNIFTI